jgi:integrase
MEEEVDQVIVGCNKKTATFLQLLKETGMRSGEAWRLQWIDLDFMKRAVRVTPEKNGEPRELPISNTLIAMLNLLPNTSQRVFGDKVLVHFSRNFRKQRLRISHKLQNPRILEITFHSLRHWKASMEF